MKASRLRVFEGKREAFGWYNRPSNPFFAPQTVQLRIIANQVAQWWEQHGRRQYPNAHRLLLLCDGGGSNAANRHVFKEALEKLADRLELEIRVAHYPPYCSKHNPIEHRLFPHITRACQGVVFHSVAIAKQFMEQARTSKGLTVTVDILTGVYETGKKCAADFLNKMRIIFDDHLPRWNYRAIPQKI